MAPQLSLVWKRLPIADSHDSRDPKIFFKLQRHEKGLKMQTTDLVYLWTAAETSVEELKQEAARTRCSIDPNEDEEQLEILIGKLEEAISGRHGGTVSLVGDRKALSPVNFDIETSIPLPSPLGMLEWTFRMIREEPSVLTSELVLPALQAIEKSTKSEQGLLKKIKEKDHVIGKLMDKIEGAGIDLSMVFPGFAGARKALTARQAAHTVPGIEHFREDQWERQLKHGDDGDGIREIVKALRDPETQEVVWKGPMIPVMKSGRDQSRGVHHGFTKRGRQTRSAMSAPVLDHDCDSSDASIRKTEALHESNSSSSSPDPVGSEEASSKPGQKKSRVLGSIKSKLSTLSKQKSASSFSELPAEAPRKPSSGSPDTLAESVTQLDPESLQTAARFQGPTAKKSTSKVGAIGGRKPQSTSRETTESPKVSGASRSRSMPSRGKSRPGAIGGRKDKTAGPSARERDSTASPVLSPASDFPLEEPTTVHKAEQTRSASPAKKEETLTEADRANRKRLELKRQLDQGAGKKKKRKF